MNLASDSKFKTRKWNIASGQSNTNYNVRNIIIYNTEALKYNICDYNKDYILVRGDIITIAHINQTPVAVKICAPFNKCTTKIDGTTIGDVEDLDLVMQMYNGV